MDIAFDTKEIWKNCVLLLTLKPCDIEIRKKVSNLVLNKDYQRKIFRI